MYVEAGALEAHAPFGKVFPMKFGLTAPIAIAVLNSSFHGPMVHF